LSIWKQRSLFLEIHAACNNANKLCDTLAFRNCKLEDLSFRTQLGADVSVRDTKNNTAVHFTAVVYNINNIRLLVGKRASVKLINIHDEILKHI
jgi:hypothetical protein